MPILTPFFAYIFVSFSFFPPFLQPFSASFPLPSLQCHLLSVHCCAASHSAGQPVLQFWDPPWLLLPQCVVVFCLWELSCAMLLCPGAKALSYCLLPYGSQHQHGDKPVLMLFPDLLRHPAGTKCRNNYYPNYPGQLRLVFVYWGWIGGSSEVQGEMMWREVPHKRRPPRGWSHAASHTVY